MHNSGRFRKWVWHVAEKDFEENKSKTARVFAITSSRQGKIDLQFHSVEPIERKGLYFSHLAKRTKMRMSSSSRQFCNHMISDTLDPAGAKDSFSKVNKSMAALVSIKQFISDHCLSFLHCWHVFNVSYNVRALSCSINLISLLLITSSIYLCIRVVIVFFGSSRHAFPFYNEREAY